MRRRPPRSTRTATLFPYTTLFRSCHLGAGRRVEAFCLTGGTPVIAHLQRLMDDLRKRFEFCEYDSAEHSIEVDLHHTRSEEHTPELQSLMRISYAVFCLKKETLQLKYS